MAVRALRGATCLQRDNAAEMTEAVTELLQELLERNEITEDDFVSIIFTSTTDLHCAFPATAARSLGFAEVPLLCAQELDVPGALPRVVRVMAHVEMDRAKSDIVHVFLRGAQVLREDLAK